LQVLIEWRRRSRSETNIYQRSGCLSSSEISDRETSAERRFYTVFIMHFEDLEECFPFFFGFVALYSSEAIHSSALKIGISSSYIVIWYYY
jgi:hypothetical protein